MHTRPSAEYLMGLSGGEQPTGSSFVVDNDGVEKDINAHNWSGIVGGCMARNGGADIERASQVPGEEGVRIARQGLYMKTAGLIFQNPSSGLGSEATSIRRARYGDYPKETAFETPRYR